MSRERAQQKPCARCGNPRPPGRTKYCGDECWQLARSEAAQARQAKRLQACKRCGGTKELGIRGGKYCATCREAIADSSELYERERGRRRVAARRAEREATGDPTLRPLTYKDGDKWCARCEEYRPCNAFSERKGGKLAPYCRPCQKSYNSERRMKLEYGLTWDEYDLIFACQDGRCAICDGRPRKHNLSIDHDHKTGEIRGLLCSRCNHRLLGSANDDPARLRKAADYLEAYGPREVFGAPRYVPGYGGAS